MRYFFEIAYKGTNYHGWQRQPNVATVQEIVEIGLSKILRENITILGSGRTDTGVHCEQQYFHVEPDTEIPDPDDLLFKINSYLPKDIAIKRIVEVDDDAHARFSATSRSYEYRICLLKNPFADELYNYLKVPVNIKTMNKAAALLLGKKDFESFSRVKTDVSNFYCEITEANWVQEGNNLIFRITANRFLRGMVRTIVGSLLEVGQGKYDAAHFEQIILGKDRKLAGSAALAQGLFLTKVMYPPHIIKP
ncbi:MAG TPA: tRNA pseudouridine(38-40) synthase TruA [Fulvivirga sp.]|nr:tRNA pseudouridine(38-40) synthase TruA [Fulvivirga sp.]